VAKNSGPRKGKSGGGGLSNNTVLNNKQ